MRKIDLSDKALGVLISMAESATSGRWIIRIEGEGPCKLVRKTNGRERLIAEVHGDADAIYLASCDPDTIRAMCGTLVRLRGDIAEHKTTIADLEAEIRRLRVQLDQRDTEAVLSGENSAHLE